MSETTNDTALDRDLRSLLSQWAAVEPQRCRQKNDTHFDVQYAGQWLPVKDDSASHGAIIAAILEACQSNQIYCCIEYTPRYEDQPPTIQVGCVFRAFLWDEGDEVISSIPSFLLIEYLEQLQADKTDN